MLKGLNKLLYKAFNSHEYVMSYMIGVIASLMPNLLFVTIFLVIVIIFSVIYYRKSELKFWSMKSLMVITCAALGVFMGGGTKDRLFKTEIQKCQELVTSDERNECLDRVNKERQERPWYLKL